MQFLRFLNLCVQITIWFPSPNWSVLNTTSVSSWQFLNKSLGYMYIHAYSYGTEIHAM
jgi:hypothetical protein